jgi:hypothetical protein
MPVILSSPSNARRCVATLERHYLANEKDNLFFALLVDFKDAVTQRLEEDALIISSAEEGISALNQKYPNRNLTFSDSRIFFFKKDFYHKYWANYISELNEGNGFRLLHNSLRLLQQRLRVKSYWQVLQLLLQAAFFHAAH